MFKNIWFRCITVLLAIIVVSGGALAILNDVLFVSAEERTARAVKALYGENKEYSIILDVDNTDNAINQKITYSEYGSINKIYSIEAQTSKSEDYDLLFQATGEKGYKNGSITLWVLVEVRNGDMRIEKIVLAGYTKQTLMSKVGKSFYNKFMVDVLSSDYFTSDVNGSGEKNVISGATYSAQAGCNAVNCVIKYVQENFGGNA